MWTSWGFVHNIYSPSFPISHCQHTWQLSKVYQHLLQFKSSALGETQWETARNCHPALLTHKMNFRLAPFVVITFQPITTGSACDRQWGKELLLGMDLVQELFSSHRTPFAEHIYIIKAHCVFGFFGSLRSEHIQCKYALLWWAPLIKVWNNTTMTVRRKIIPFWRPFLMKNILLKPVGLFYVS